MRRFGSQAGLKQQQQQQCLEAIYPPAEEKKAPKTAILLPLLSFSVVPNPLPDGPVLSPKEGVLVLWICRCKATRRFNLLPRSKNRCGSLRRWPFSAPFSQRTVAFSVARVFSIFKNL